MFTIRDIFENRKKFFNVLKESYFNKKYNKKYNKK